MILALMLSVNKRQGMQMRRRFFFFFFGGGGGGDELAENKQILSLPTYMHNINGTEIRPLASETLPGAEKVELKVR